MLVNFQRPDRGQHNIGVSLDVLFYLSERPARSTLGKKQNKTNLGKKNKGNSKGDCLQKSVPTKFCFFI